MKLNRCAANTTIAITTFACLLILSGCGGGGKKTQQLDSPYRGDLYGVEMQPTNQETDIALDSWIRVYWPHADYPPPAQFTVSVDKEESANVWGAIHTKMNNDATHPANGDWWFEPESNFSPNTWYRITVKDDAGRQSMFYFRTIVASRSIASSLSATSTDAAAKTYKPLNATSSTSAGALEHVIKTVK